MRIAATAAAAEIAALSFRFASALESPSSSAASACVTKTSQRPDRMMKQKLASSPCLTTSSVAAYRLRSNQKKRREIDAAVQSAKKAVERSSETVSFICCSMWRRRIWM